MTFQDQPRRPGGFPAGGQFLARIHPEAGRIDLRELITDEEHNADGTFAFPPSPRSARQAIAFWMGVEVPDRMLLQVDIAHNYLVNCRRADAEDGASKVALSSKARQERAAVSAAANTPYIPPCDLRSVVRLTKLFAYAQGLPPDEQAKVNTCEFTLDSGNRFTPPGVIAHYDLGAIKNDFSDYQERASYETLVETRNLLTDDKTGTLRSY